MNEIALLCEKVGADVNEVRAGIGSDSRIGAHFLFPGLGFGGSCFPKDLQAIFYTGQEKGVELKLVKAAIDANYRQKQAMPLKVRARFSDDLTGHKFAVWGIAFKANTDDTRESPAIALIDALLEAGATVTAYDPQAMEGANREYGERIGYATESYDALHGASALIIATEWNEFRNPDFLRIKSMLKNPVIFDGRNLYNPTEVRALGFEYFGVGNG
jgi:UDPglucose 6-dehydrogenase